MLPLTRWPWSPSEYWNQGDLVPSVSLFQTVGVEMSLFLLEFSSIAFDSRKTPVPFDNGQGFLNFPASLSQRKLIPNTFSTEVFKGRWNSGSYCGLLQPQVLMWSLSNLKDPGGNILTMLVIILQNTWILNTVVFQYKWWLFLFMSLIWFCSCNTATQFCEGGNNTWFLYKNVSQCVILEKWREGVWGDWKKLIKKA